MKRLALLATLLALVAIIMSPVSAFAATTGNTVVSGNVPATVSLTATSNLTLPSLVPGTAVESSYITVTVNTNTSGWSLTAAESSGGDGLMSTSGGVTMTNPLEVQGGNLSTYTPLSSTVVLRNANGTPGNIPFDNIKFRQSVSSSQAAGDYSIIVVFTISGGA
jgi:hypothetical protein